MVKVQKPLPKTIKKAASELKKVQTKKTKEEPLAKKVKKTLQEVVKNEVREEKLKQAVQNKKSKILEKAKEIPQKRKNKDAVQEKKFAKTSLKITQDLHEAESVHGVAPKTKTKFTKDSKKVNDGLEENSEELPKTKDNSLLKSKPAVNLEQPVNKIGAKNSTSLKKKSKHDGKIFSKKTLGVKSQQAAKTTLPKEVRDLEPEKEVVTEKKTLQKVGKKPLPSTVKTSGQNKSVSKDQIKSSNETKNEVVIGSKLKKDERKDKKVVEKEQDENVKSDGSKSTTYEADNFDEDKFKDIVTLENIKKISKALKVLVEKEVSEKKTAVFSDYTYFLNVAYFKIPNCPKRMVKLNLKHALVNPETDDVVIIVPDLKRGAKADFEPTIQHYEDILRENGVENIKVLPLNQLRNEYSSYEAKRKLSNTYDRFLCDGRIVGHVVGFCGKHFQKPRTTIHAVTLNDPKTFKSEIEHALKRTSYRQLNKGDLISIPVGNHKFTTNQLAENIQTVIDQLKTILPGSYPNIRNIHIKIDIRGTSSIPLYVNLAAVPAEVPNIIGPREQRMIKLKKEANEVLSKFSMCKTGDFVKLNKTQLKRKLKLRETRAALESTENVIVDENASELDPPMNKKSKKQLDEHDSEEEVSEDGVDESEEDSEDDDE